MTISRGSDIIALVSNINHFEEVSLMAISYNRLWKLLIDRKMKKIELQRAAGISGNVLLRLNKDEPVTMDSLYKICHVLHCNVGDVMEFTDTEEEQQ